MSWATRDAISIVARYIAESWTLSNFSLGLIYVRKTNGPYLAQNLIDVLNSHDQVPLVSGVVVDGGANLQSCNSLLEQLSGIGSKTNIMQATSVKFFCGSCIAHALSDAGGVRLRTNKV